MLAVALVCGWLGCGKHGERGVPEEVVRHNVLGTAYLGQQKWTEAQQEFERAIELRPRDALLLNNLAVAEVQQGRLDEAERHFREAIAVDPEQPYARYGLGTLLKNRGDFAAAAEQFEVVERVDPDDLMTHYNLGMVYSRIDREVEAKQRFERALELDPTHVSSLYGLGRLLLQAGDQERGMELINRSQAIRERSGLDEAVGTQYGEQGPYAMGADYPGWALAAPEPIAVRFAQRASAALEPASDGSAVVAFAAAPRASDGRPIVYVVDGSGALRSFDADGTLTTILAPPQAHVVAVAAGAMRRDSTVIDLVALESSEGGLRVVVLPNAGRAQAGDAPAPAFATSQPPINVDATLVDRDHDGDLDVFFCWTSAENAGCGFGTNDGAGHLTLSSSADHGFPITFTGPGRVHVGFTDFDNDRDIDLLVGRPGRFDLFSNLRDGTFEPISEGGLVPGEGDVTGAFAVADLDKNGWMDLVLGTTSGDVRAYKNVRGRFDHLGSFLRASARTSVENVVVFDHDNDGFLDIARPSRDGLVVNRNLGAREWTSEPLSYSDADASPLSPLAALDADGDGDLDLVVARGGAEPGLALLANEGGNAYGFVRIVSHGVGDNAYGIGAKVEVLAGALRQKHEIVSPLPLHQGLGPRKTVESVRHVWPGGVLQDEIALEAGRAVEVTQLDRKGTSCPLLYARDAEGGWRFVTDFLGGSAVGYRLGPNTFGTPDPDEYVKIEGGIAPAPDGTLRLRVNNQLQEVIWFDTLELVVVDHPDGTEVFPSERLLPGPPWAPFELYAGSDLRAVRRATSSQAKDVTELVARLDRRHVRDFALLPFKGYAEPHALDLDLGPLPARERVVLLLDGWIDYADSSANVAAAQAGLALSPPRLLVGDGGGDFRDAGLRMGFPAGLPKTMTVDLTGRLDPRDPRVRIETNMRIYWDRARVLVGGADVPLGIMRVPVRTAELREGGFPRELRPDPAAPPVYDAAHVARRSPWTVHTGRYTAFGEVADLLAAVDDRFVTTRSGDEIELMFPAPPAARGARTLLLHADGFGKDMDPNSAAADAVAPIPFHGMPAYPYGDDVRPPARSPAEDRLTRLVADWPPGAPGAVPQPVIAADATIDLVISGGTLIDGTGAPGRRADVAIDDGIVVGVGDLGAVAAARVIDARGRIVAPGFVDLHSHADLVLLADPATRDRLLEARLRQGITTLVVGNCGLGVAPSSPDAATILAGVNAWMTPADVAAGPLSIAEYLARIERDAAPPLNVGTLLPHGPVRISAMGLAPGEPDRAQLAAMREAVERGLAEGALGLSVGLIYPPGMYSATDELVELARVVARYDGLFAAHVRGSSETLLPATDELLEIARQSGARVHHSHLEAVGHDFWPRIPDVLALEDAARREGLAVSHDVFPYHRAATMMSAIFPPWSLEGGVPALLERLADPGSREAIRRDIAEHVPEWPPLGPGGWPHNLVQAVGWDGIVVASVGPGGRADAVGRSLADLAAASHADPFDVVAALLVAEHGQVGQLVAEISGDDEREAPLLEILAHPAAAVITDAEDYGRGSPHPAHAGAFARALRLARERGTPALEELVRRMTSYPASLVRLRDRGVIRPGAAADVVVFDAGRVADRATFEEPRLAPEGITHVLVNGEVVVDDGAWVGGRHGRVLRAQPSSGTACLIRSSSPSGVRASTSTMRRDAVPSP